MDASLQAQVRTRAAGCCEYCRIPEAVVRLSFQVDHIIAEQHGGPTALSNLAWSCLPCNKRKGPNLAGIDRKTRKLVPLFHPRRHKWGKHFRWDGPLLRGRTPSAVPPFRSWGSMNPSTWKCAARSSRKASSHLRNHRVRAADAESATPAPAVFLSRHRAGRSCRSFIGGVRAAW
jgi:hypothetical protein